MQHVDGNSEMRSTSKSRKIWYAHIACLISLKVILRTTTNPNPNIALLNCSQFFLKFYCSKRSISLIPSFKTNHASQNETNPHVNWNWRDFYNKPIEVVENMSERNKNNNSWMNPVFWFECSQRKYFPSSTSNILCKMRPWQKRWNVSLFLCWHVSLKSKNRNDNIKNRGEFIILLSGNFKDKDLQKR